MPRKERNSLGSIVALMTRNRFFALSSSFFAIDIDLSVLRNNCQLVSQFWIERLKRIVESVTGGPRGLANDDLPPPLGQFVFVNRGYSALPGPDVADDYEMFREIYRIKNREDWKFWFGPFVSCFLYKSSHSLLWESWKTIIKINAELVASQGRLEPSRIPFP